MKNRAITYYEPRQRSAVSQLSTILDGSVIEMLNRIQRDFFRDSFFSDPEKWAYPKRDIVNLDDRIEIICTVPGLKRENIHLSVDNNVIWLKADKMEDTTYKKEQVEYSQIKRSSWSSPIFKFNDSFNIEEVDASLENGLLTVSIPRKKTITCDSKEIEIR